MRSKTPVIAWADDALALVTVTEALAAYSPGARVVTASGPEDLLDCLRNGEAASVAEGRRLVFVNLDAMGPGALDLLREIKADPLLRRTPLLAYADAPSDDLVLGAYEGGVNAFIERPRSAAEVEGVVARALAFWLDTAKLAHDPFAPPRKPSAHAPGEYADFAYRIFPEHRLGVAVKSGVLHGRNLLRYIERFFNDPVWQAGYDILDDYRSVTRIDITASEAREVARVLIAHRSSIEGGRTAVVVAAWMHQLVGEALIAMGRLDRDRVQVFRSLDEALAWLEVPADLLAFSTGHL